MNNNIYVMGVDMEERSVEEIAWDAANQIVELFDRLVEEQNQDKYNRIFAEGGTNYEL